MTCNPLKILILLLIPMTGIWSQNPNCVDQIAISIQGHSTKSYAFRKGGLKNYLRRSNTKTKVFKDEYHNRNLEEWNLGNCSFYFLKDEMIHFVIKDENVELQIGRDIALSVGSDKTKLLEYFPLAYRNQKKSFSREGFRFIQLPICNDAGQSTDAFLIISWKEELGRIDRIYISDPS